TRIEEHRSFTFTNNIVYFNSGTLFSSNWHKINLLTDYNCYWDTRTKDIKFGTSSFTEWQKSGKDIHSIIADPLFINADGFDFRFRNRSVIKKIKFIPFDYTEAGVYGSDEWKKTAVFSRILEKKFDETVAKMESR
ncbi:MAG TPA: right-handed parallel beta-helix repeat-containing protein, partial [Bacteroidales bacterium]|nr:right-handed parallel beta-helix repeat-containing protein [Bacteroidales bacterium]